MGYLIGAVGLIATIIFSIKLNKARKKGGDTKAILKKLIIAIALFFVGSALTPDDTADLEGDNQSSEVANQEEANDEQQQPNDDVTPTDEEESNNEETEQANNSKYVDGYTLRHGELLTVVNHEEEKVIVFKAKIEPSLTNGMTIKQNYFNVADLITRQGLEDYELIDYWAIADMMDGSESKVIAFTLDKDDIESIANGYPENKIGDIANDLWILPSLLK